MRFRQARTAGKTEAELLRQLNEVVRRHYKAPVLLPPDAVDDLAGTHNQLGAICGEAGDSGRALQHLQEAIRLHVTAGNLFYAARVAAFFAGFKNDLKLSSRSPDSDVCVFVRRNVREVRMSRPGERPEGCERLRQRKPGRAAPRSPAVLSFEVELHCGADKGRPPLLARFGVRIDLTEQVGIHGALYRVRRHRERVQHLPAL